MFPYSLLRTSKLEADPAGDNEIDRLSAKAIHAYTRNFQLQYASQRNMYTDTHMYVYIHVRIRVYNDVRTPFLL